MQQDPRSGSRHDLPGPDDLHEPDDAGRQADCRVHSSCTRHLSRQEAKEEAIKCLKQVNIPNPEERAKQYPHEFSGGMRQRAMIAMALSLQPEAADCRRADDGAGRDDSGADYGSAAWSCKDKINTAIILITHDLGVVAGHCRPRGRHVCGQGGRDRHDRADFLRAQASVHRRRCCAACLPPTRASANR